MNNRQYQGAINRAQGKHFEQYIDLIIAYYKERGLAMIEKTPEPMVPCQSLPNGRFVAYFQKKAQPDYIGFTRKGTEACLFKLALSKSYGKVDYIDVAAGGVGAALCAENLRKGMLVEVDGYFWLRKKMQAVLIAEQIHQVVGSQGQILAGLYYKDVLPPAEGYYSTGDGPFDTIYQPELTFN